ncbi:hypothetical protein HDU97_000714 [Phlyctochytrium planicorne]|nr:hypothetical protein HDU97_000714 [Phlyctochytrium planicorne]
MNPRMDEAFMIFRRQRLLNERFSGGDVIDFIAFEQNMQLARKYESKATLAVIHFWAELLKRHPSFWKLQSHGATISSAVSLAQSHYLALIKLSPNTANVYRLYGHFLINVLNDAKQGQDLIDHADELEEETENNRENGELEELNDIDLSFNILSENNATVTISGELYNIGTVLNINNLALKAWGYKKSEVINQNISKLIPSPFAASHDAFIKKYLDTGIAKVVDRTRQVLGLNKQGYLFPITLCVKHVVDSKGTQSFVGIVRTPPEGDGMGFAIMNSDMEVLHFSRNLGSLFDTKPILPSSEESPAPPKISDWLPVVTLESISQFLSKSGMKTQYYTDRRLYDVTIHADAMPLNGSTYYICRFRYTEFKASQAMNERSSLTEGRQSRRASETRSQIMGCPFASSASRPIASSQGDRNRGEGSNDSVAIPMSFSRNGSNENMSQDSESNGVPTVEIGQAQLNPPMSHVRRTSFAGPDALIAFQQARLGMNSHQRANSLSSSSHSHPLSGATKEESGVGRFEEFNDNDDDRQSRGSRGSRGSRVSSAKSYLKRVINMKNEKSNRRLQYLGSAFLLSLSLLGVISVIEYIEFRKVFEKVYGSLHRIQDTNDLSVRLIQLAHSARSLDVLSRSNQIDGLESLPSEMVSKTRIDEDSDHIRISAEVFAGCNAESVRLKYADGSLSYPMNPLDAISTIVASARYLATAPLADIDHADQTRFVIENAPFEVLRSMNSCSTADHDLTTRLGTQQPKEILILATIGPFISLFVWLFVVQPLYIRISDNKEKFLRMFYEIPKEVVKGIYESHYRKVHLMIKKLKLLERLTSAEDEDGDGDDDNEMINKLALEKVLNSNHEVDKGDKGPASSLNNQVAEDIGRNFITRWFAKATHDHHKVALKSSIVFFLTVAYFFIIGGLSYAYLSTVAELGSEIFWSSQRSIFVREMTFFAREIYFDVLKNSTIANGTVLTVPTNSMVSRDQIRFLAQELDGVEVALLFGNEILNLDGAVTKGYNDPWVVLEFQNGCTAEMPASCSTFNQGVMTRGLYAATNWFSKMAKSIANSTFPSSTLTNSSSIYALDKTISTLSELDDKHLNAGFDVATMHQLSDISYIIGWFSTFNLAFTITYVILLAGIYFFLFRPLVRTLGEDQRRTAALVYMLPPEVFVTVPSFKNWAQKHLSITGGSESKKETV